MLTDSIKMRKIRYDVLQYIEEIELLDSIQNYIDNPDKTVDEGKELISKISGEYAAELEEICEKLNSHIDSYYDYDSVNHSTLLDYIFEIYKLEQDDNRKDDLINQKMDVLYNFLFQLVQIQKLQAKIVDTIYDTMYQDEDNNIYSAIDNKLMIEYTDIVGEKKNATKDDFNLLAMRYINNIIIKTKRKMILNLEFDNVGFYLAANGDQYFEDDEREEILKETSSRMNIILGTEQNLTKEEITDFKEQETEELDDFEDDVSVSVQHNIVVHNDTKQRFDNLKNILKDSSNKITKSRS